MINGIAVLTKFFDRDQSRFLSVSEIAESRSVLIYSFSEPPDSGLLLIRDNFKQILAITFGE